MPSEQIPPARPPSPQADRGRGRVLLDKLSEIGWNERALLVEATFWLAVARLALLVPFRWLAPRLGETMTESPEEDAPEADLGDRIAWAVAVASRYAPWATACLAEAIAAKAMLRLRGVPTTLYLGMAKGADGELSAHAWLRCGRRYLTGGKIADGFTVVAKFAEAPPR